MSQQGEGIIIPQSEEQEQMEEQQSQQDLPEQNGKQQVEVKQTQCMNCNETFTYENLNEYNSFCCEECLDKQVFQEIENMKAIDKDISLQKNYITQIESDIQEAQQINGGKWQQQSEEKQQQLQQDMNEQKEIEVKLKDELQILKNEILDLEKSESEYWNKINNHQKNFVKLEEKIQQAERFLKKLDQDIESINQINVLNDVFLINVEEQTGTINNLQIGKKKDQTQIEWDITNAGLGQLCMLFTYLQQKFNYNLQFIEYIACNGNYSTLQRKIPLSGNTGSLKTQHLNIFGPIGKETSEDEFNQALTLFLIEFNHFCEFLSHSETLINKQIQINLPYPVVDDTLVSQGKKYSIQVNKEGQKWDNWTLAMKYLLSNFKYIISVNAQHDCKAEEMYLQDL